MRTGCLCWEAGVWVSPCEPAPESQAAGSRCGGCGVIAGVTVDPCASGLKERGGGCGQVPGVPNGACPGARAVSGARPGLAGVVPAGHVGAVPATRGDLGTASRAGPGRQAALPSLSRACGAGTGPGAGPAQPPGQIRRCVLCSRSRPLGCPPQQEKGPPWDGQLLFSPAQAHVETLPGAQPQALMLLRRCQGHVWSPQPPRAGVPALLPVGSGQALAARSQQAQAGDRTG